MDILRFALICLHFLAWPLVALGYPLIASMRAIESGSKYHMRKLVTYWTLFALISLFEFAFSKFILWIPLWSTIRLAAIFWLVLPQFDGACHAYQTLVRLLSSVSRGSVIQGPKEETGISIQENRSKAVGDLIVSKKQQECSDPQREIQVTEAVVQNASWVSILLKEPKAAQQHNGTLQTCPVQEGQQEQEWRCDLCKVKVTCEGNLNDHLKGRKHKAKCVSLKALMLNAKPAKRKAKPSKEVQTSKRHCNVCDVALLDVAQAFSHFNGKRHLSNLRKTATPGAVLSSP